MQTNSFFFSLFSVSTTTCRDMFTIQELGFCFPNKTSTDTIMEPKKKKIINFLSFTFFFFPFLFFSSFEACTFRLILHSYTTECIVLTVSSTALMQLLIRRNSTVSWMDRAEPPLWMNQHFPHSSTLLTFFISNSRGGKSSF